ncbi:MAG TPA: hypothetical protein VEJ87_06440 [Acidimicrobiales bacterium]|nr:hypothetical protein [Acidimicrobiales bacterium]
MDDALEGWYTDPYGVHEARWMSVGRPTDLVRDGETEARDPAPDEPFKITPLPIETGSDFTAAADLRRADEAAGYPEQDAERPEDAAWGGAGENMA